MVAVMRRNRSQKWYRKHASLAHIPFCICNKRLLIHCMKAEPRDCQGVTCCRPELMRKRESGYSHATLFRDVSLRSLHKAGARPPKLNEEPSFVAHGCAFVKFLCHFRMSSSIERIGRQVLYRSWLVYIVSRARNRQDWLTKQGNLYETH